MWKILGADALYVEFAAVWKERIMKIVPEGDDGKRFRKLMKAAEVLHIMNGATEEHTFLVQMSEKVSKEDVQFMADIILNVARTAEFPFVSLNDVRERCQVIFTAEKEPELIGLDKTKGYSSGAVFAPILEGWGNAGNNGPAL